MPEPWSWVPGQTPGCSQRRMYTEQTPNSNRFQAGCGENPQEIRNTEANFNKFLGP
jgi:hypothetical protein